MKTIFRTIIILMACVVASCAPEITFDKSSLGAPSGGSLTSVSDDTLEAIFTSEGGSATLSFSVNQDWTVEALNTRADNWCSFSPTGGKKGTFRMTVNVKPNDTYDERNASIILKSGELTRTIRVTQKQRDAVLLSASSFNIAEEGGTISLEVRANVSYSYQIDQSCASWVKEATTKGLDSRNLTFEISPNEEFSSREGAILFTGDAGISETVKIYQDGATPRIILTQSEYAVSDKGEEIKVEVRSNVNVKYSISDDWISEVATKAMSTNTYIFAVKPNTTYDERTAFITFTNDEQGLSETVYVVQMQKDAIVVTPGSVNVDSDGGDITIKLGHNVDYSTAIDVDWISKTDTKAFTTESLSFHIEANPSNDNREGHITFTSADGSIKQTVAVLQAQKNSLVITETQKTLGPAGGSFDVVIKANVEFTVEGPGVSWIHKVDTKAMTTTTLHYTVDANTTYESRSAEIKVTSAVAGKSETVYITQAQKDAIVLGQSYYNIPSEGDSFSVSVGHNVEFTTDIDVSWISAVTTKSYTTDILTFEVDENTTESSREGHITFTSADKSIVQVIDVIQDAPGHILTKLDVYGIYDVSGAKPVPIVEVDEDNQYACATRINRREFRIQSYYEGYVIYISLPKSVSEGQLLGIEVSSVGIGTVTEGSFTVKALQVSGSDIWLLDESRNIGYIIARED